MTISIVIDAEKHREQASFIKCSAFASAFIAGRRGGKTMGGAIKAAIKLIKGGTVRQKFPELPPYTGLVTGPSYNSILSGPFPTYVQVLRDFNLLIPEKDIGHMVRGASGGGPYIELGYDLGTIIFRTTEDPDLLRGGTYIFAHMDETRDSSEEAFDVILPSLMQKGMKPQIWVATTPIGFDHWTYRRFHDVNPSTYAFFTCAMEDNNYLTEEQKETIRKGYEGLNEEWIRQELGGEYVVMSGLCRFNISILRGFLDQTKEPAYNDGLVEVYKEPMIGRSYIAGADSSEGVGRDAASCQILDVQTGEQVCVIYGQIPPSQFAELIVRFCRRYNNARLSVPSDPIDLATLAKIEVLGYNNVCERWKTASVKGIMEADLAEAIGASAIVLYRKNTVKELLSYVRDETGHYHAAKGCRDDEVASLMAAWQVRKEPRVFAKGDIWKPVDYVRWR